MGAGYRLGLAVVGMLLLEAGRVGAADAGGEDAIAAAQAKELKWCQDVFVGTYERSGHKSAEWDGPARRALEAMARKWAYATSPTNDENDVIREAAGKAVKAGCDDPVVLYAAAWSAALQQEGKATNYAVRAAEGMKTGDYPAILKFYADGHAAEALGKNSKGAAIARGRKFFEEGVGMLPALAGDEAIGRRRWLDAFAVYADAATALDGEESTLVDGAIAELAKHTKDESLVETLKEAAAVRRAWAGRGGDWAGKVTDKGWQIFHDQLAVAAEAGQKAWDLDNGNYLAAEYMLSVGLGQSWSRADMDTWHGRALDGNPDARSADEAMLTYLDPRWGGSGEEQLKFARECAASGDWERLRPTVLTDAYLIQSYFDGQGNLRPEMQPGYFKRHPEAFVEMKPVYEEMLKRHPGSVFWRAEYATVAVWSEQWDVAAEQMKRLGSRWSATWGQDQKKLRAAVRANAGGEGAATQGEK